MTARGRGWVAAILVALAGCGRVGYDFGEASRGGDGPVGATFDGPPGPDAGGSAFNGVGCRDGLGNYVLCPAYCCSGDPPMCVTSEAACPETVLTCDGPEDCGGGEQCCLQPLLGRAGCAATCSSIVFCHEDVHCPPTSPSCCPSGSNDFCSDC